MDTGDRKPEKLIEDIISFLEKERELFGAFSVSGYDPTDNTDTMETEKSISADQNTGDIQSAGDKQNHPVSKNDDRDTATRLEKCKTLDELKEFCKKADELKTDLGGTNLVFGVGNPDADLMLIGEAPGAEEDRQGEPFVGAAGQLLNKILAAIGFNREDVYIANILKHRPPNNRNPRPEERERSLPYLLRQIELVNPKLILCLGKISAQTLLESEETLGSMRGQFHKFMNKHELLATYHPAALLRHERWKRPTWEDVKLLRKRYDELDCKP